MQVRVEADHGFPRRKVVKQGPMDRSHDAAAQRMAPAQDEKEVP